MSAIIVENLAKRYQIGHQVRHDTLRDSLTYGARNLLASFGRGERTDSKEFWALSDVSFTVEPGEVVGIIGRNGAGKSTLLKLLSRITEPTKGRITLNGRIASLLEVGTGFHPELSGRENIFLNGAILGMSRSEIRAKFDEIVAFAEVEQFIDTPVKRYSSGMYVRLAFAVAAHLEPEILIIDEVLAVGDLRFQKKCMDKIKSISTSGDRTVLLVSHNPSAISRLCTRALYLDQGKSDFFGPTQAALQRYQNRGAHLLRPDIKVPLDQRTSPKPTAARFHSIRVSALDQADFVSGFTPEITLEILAQRDLSVDNLALSLNAGDQVKLFNADSEKLGQTIHLKTGMNRVVFKTSALALSPRQYQIHLWMANSRLSEVFDFVTEDLILDLLDAPAMRDKQRPENDGYLDLPFTITNETS